MQDTQHKDAMGVGTRALATEWLMAVNAVKKKRCWWLEQQRTHPHKHTYHRAQPVRLNDRVWFAHLRTNIAVQSRAHTILSRAIGGPVV